MISVTSLLIGLALAMSASALALAIFGIRRIYADRTMLSAQFERTANTIDALEKEVDEVSARLSSLEKESCARIAELALEFDTRMKNPEPNKALSAKEAEEPVKQFRGAIGYRKFMEEGRVTN